jgi:threonine dehydratase
LSTHDDAAIVAGQGTVALEMLHAVPELTSVICGLVCIDGADTAARAIKPGIEIVGVKP